MEIFKNKLLLKLIASLCVFLALFNFAMTNAVYAANEEDEEVFGGVLLVPVMRLLTGLGDGIMDIIHNAVLEQNETLIRLDGKADTWWDAHGASVLGWITAIGIVVCVLTAIPTGGASIAAGAGFLSNITGAAFVIKAVGTGIFARSSRYNWCKVYTIVCYVRRYIFTSI